MTVQECLKSVYSPHVTRIINKGERSRLDHLPDRTLAHLPARVLVHHCVYEGNSCRVLLGALITITWLSAAKAASCWQDDKAEELAALVGANFELVVDCFGAAVSRDALEGDEMLKDVDWFEAGLFLSRFI